jgi:hypothetical protein
VLLHNSVVSVLKYYHLSKQYTFIKYFFDLLYVADDVIVNVGGARNT